MFRYIIFNYKDFPPVVSEEYPTAGGALSEAYDWIAPTPLSGIKIEIVEQMSIDAYAKREDA